MLEKDIEAKLVAGVKKAGGRAYKFISPGNVGVPDRLVLLPHGRVIFAELKTDTGRTSAAQQLQIAKLMELGMDVRVLYGVDAVTAFLEEVSGV